MVAIIIKSSIIIGCFVSASALASTAPDTTVIDQKALELCYAEADDKKRLFCYEALTLAVRTLKTSVMDVGPINADVKTESVAVAPRLVSIGREQLRSTHKPPKKQVPVTVTVTSVTKDALGRLSFYLQNGDIWRQLERGYVVYPKQSLFQVEIARGLMGEYRLRIEGKGRRVAIRRIR